MTVLLALAVTPAMLSGCGHPVRLMLSLSEPLVLGNEEHQLPPLIELLLIGTAAGAEMYICRASGSPGCNPGVGAWEQQRVGVSSEGDACPLLAAFPWATC